MEEISLEISDISRGGMGLARHVTPEGQVVVFVPYSAPGDRVTVEVVKKEKRYWQGRLIRLDVSSTLRTEPRCAVFGKCGGCSWQHLPYEFQWKTKVEGVKFALKRVALESGAIDRDWDLFPAQNPWNYRNRVQLRIENGQLGMYESGSRNHVPVTECSIARNEINEAIAKFRPRPQTRKVEFTALGAGNVITDENSRHAAQGFRQVNDDQNEELVSWVTKKCQNYSTILDLFGGAGNLTKGLINQGKKIWVVDSGINRRLERECTRFSKKEVHRWCSDVRPQDIADPNVVAVLDPPRMGLDPHGGTIVENLRRLGVSAAILIGCDPDSFARDLKKFVSAHWEITNMAAFDFFPQTPHVESSALMKARTNFV